ncbi:mediator of RNA polymerase II transcription subunit 11-like protein isoform X1 [Tanacetum coccineum]
MDSQNQNASLQRLQTVEKRIVRVLELAGGVMEEFLNPSGPRKELVNSHCSEFMQIMKVLHSPVECILYRPVF